MQQILNENLTKARGVYNALKDFTHIPAKCVEILTEKGISTKSGKPWTEHIIRAVLRGDYYDENVLFAVIEAGEGFIKERQRSGADLGQRSEKVLKELQTAHI